MQEPKAGIIILAVIAVLGIALSFCILRSRRQRIATITAMVGLVAVDFIFYSKCIVGSDLGMVKVIAALAVIVPLLLFAIVYRICPADAPAAASGPTKRKPGKVAGSNARAVDVPSGRPVQQRAAARNAAQMGYAEDPFDDDLDEPAAPERERVAPESPAEAAAADANSDFIWSQIPGYTDALAEARAQAEARVQAAYLRSAYENLTSGQLDAPLVSGKHGAETEDVHGRHTPEAIAEARTSESSEACENPASEEPLIELAAVAEPVADEPFAAIAPAESAEAIEADEIAGAAEPAVPVEPAEAAEPSGLAQAAGITEPAEPAEAVALEGAAEPAVCEEPLSGAPDASEQLSPEIAEEIDAVAQTLAEYDRLMEKARSFRDRGVYSIAARLCGEAREIAPGSGLRRKAGFEQMANLVKAGDVRSAKAIARDLRRNPVLTKAECIKLESVERLEV